MAIRDVRVGDSVMCFEGGSDLATPGLPRWCTVRSFVSSLCTIQKGCQHNTTSPAISLSCLVRCAFELGCRLAHPNACTILPCPAPAVPY